MGELFIKLFEDMYLMIFSSMNSHGLSILLLSLLTSIISICLSLFFKPYIDGNKELEKIVFREIKKINSNEINSIERLIQIERLYNRFNYHPFLNFFNVLPLLFQLPFLILAYYFFSDFSSLKDQSFLFITDLSMPDKTMFTLNVLPVFMTFMSILSLFVLSSFSIDKFIRGCALAIFFFILLYQEPSSLLLFWTFNISIMFFFNLLTYLHLPINSRSSFSDTFRMITGFLINPYFLKIIILANFTFVIYGIILKYFLQYDLSFSVFLIFILFSFLLLILFCGLFFYSTNIKSFSEFTLSFKKMAIVDNISFYDGILLLLPTSFLLQIIILNSEMLGIEQIFKVFLFIFPLIVIVPIMFSLMLKFFLPPLLTFIFIISVTAFILLLPSLSFLYSWYFYADNVIPLAIFILIFGFILYLRKLDRVSLYAVTCLFFFSMVGGSTYTFYNKEDTKLKSSSLGRDKTKLLENASFVSKPDIYLLTYDAYVNAETLSNYGIDNKDQEKFLTSLGFDLYPNTYSIASSSLSTMSLVLEGSDKIHGDSFRKNTAGNSEILNLLKDNGYVTHGILKPYFFLGEKIEYDTFFPKTYPKPNITLFQSIISGAFHFDAFDERFGDFKYEEWLLEKRKSLRSKGKAPRFVYAHSPFPKHSQNSGQCLKDEVQKFSKRLKIANLEMKIDVKTIIEQNRDAIIIINGADGPYLTGDCFTLKNFYNDHEQITRLDLQDRFGTFLAIKWPQKTQNIKSNKQIITLQDTLPKIINTIFPSSQLFRKTISNKSLGILGSGPAIKNGIIQIGINKSEKLFEGVIKSVKKE